MRYERIYLSRRRQGILPSPVMPLARLNPREFLQAEKEDQEMAEACKRLIKNCIICWNYLYLSQKLAEIDDPANMQLINSSS
jgi:hypothetical protein